MRPGTLLSENDPRHSVRGDILSLRPVPNHRAVSDTVHAHTSGVCVCVCVWVKAGC